MDSRDQELWGDELFAQAKDLPAEKQARFLDEMCRIDHAEVRNRVERLLKADRKLQQVARSEEDDCPPPGRAVRLNCPHCHNPIELVTDEKEDEVVCPSCGSSFHLDAERTRTWSQDKLPKLGKFELLSRIGAGGFGTVYKAFDSELQRTVALKLPRSASLVDRDDEDRFLREARNAAQLRHSGIVPVFEVGRSEQFPYIVSELVEGLTLSDVLTGRRFGFREVARLVQQIAEALDYSHRHGVVHRDLKPSNIMISCEGTPRIMDFGLAKREAGEITMTIDGQILGTPAYMSPEQAAGQGHHVDGRSDIYSIGVILYELLTGELPFRGNQRMLLHQVLHDEPRAPRSLNDGIPRDLETICLRAMAKEPKRRFQLAHDLAEDMGRYLDGKPIESRPVGHVERTWRWCRRQPEVASLLTAVIASLVLGLGLSSYFWWNERVERNRSATLAKDKERLANENGATARQLSHALDEQRLQTIRWEVESGLQRFSEHDSAGALHTLMRSILEIEAIASHRQVSLRPQLDRWDEALRIHLVAIATHPTVASRCIRHSAFVPHIEFSPDGSVLATASWDRTVQLIDTTTGRAIGDPLKHEYMVQCIAFSSDGNRLATGCFNSGTVYLWNVKTHELLGTLAQHGLPVWDIAFSPDDKRLATGSFDGTVQLWDAAKGDPVGNPLAHGAAAYSVAFSPDGRRLATASQDKHARIWDISTGKLQGSPLAHDDEVHHAEFSANGKRLATASNDGTVQLWEAETGKKLGAALSHEHNVDVATFNADGTKLATVAGTIAHIWDISNAEPTCHELQHNAKLSDVVFSPDGKMIATASSDGTASLWNVATATRITQFIGHRDGVFDVCFSADGRRVATSSSDGTARLWDLNNEISANRLEHQAPILQMRFSSDGKSLTTLTGLVDEVQTFLVDKQTGEEFGPLWLRSQINAQRWNLETEMLNKAGTIFQDSATVVVLSPDGRLLATASLDKKVRIWNTTTAQLHLPPLQLGSYVQRMGFCGNGKALLVYSSDGASTQWNTETGDSRGVPIQLETPLEQASFSVDGKYLATYSKDKVVRLWNGFTGDLLDVPMNGKDVLSLGMNRSGSLIAIGGNDSVCIWDVRSKRDALKPLRHDGVVSIVMFSADGELLATYSGERWFLWEVSTGHRIFATPKTYGNIQSASFSPEGARLAIATKDGFRILDAAFGHEVSCIAAVEDAAEQLEFSPDGTQLAVLSDRHVQVWDIGRADTSDSEQLLLWVEVLTGTRMDGDKQVVALSADEWESRFRRLEMLGGPPKECARILEQRAASSMLREQSR